MIILFAPYSKQLKEPVPAQPSIEDIIEAVLKECRKENMRYKIIALKCAADVLESTKEDHFQELADILFPIIKKVQSILLEFYIKIPKYIFKWQQNIHLIASLGLMTLFDALELLII